MSSNHARKRMNKLQMTSLLVATSVKSDGGKIFGTGNSLNLTNGQVGVIGYDQGDRGQGCQRCFRRRDSGRVGGLHGDAGGPGG